MVKKHRVSKLLIILVLLFALIVGAFGYPGFLVSLLQRKAASFSAPEQWNTRLEHTGSTGASQAFSISPMAGVTISAPAGALDRDYNVNATSLDVDTLQAEVDGLTDATGESFVPLFAWDLDAGMAPDEMAPGFIETTIDLQKAGVLPENYDKVEFYRIDDNGAYGLLSSHIENGVAHIRTRQNSITLGVLALDVLIASAILSTGAAVIDWLKAHWGEFYLGKTIKVECRGWTEFKIKFTRDDLLKPLLDQKKAIRQRIEQSVNGEATRYMNEYVQAHPELTKEQKVTLKQQKKEELAEAKIQAEKPFEEIDKKIENLSNAKNYTPENLAYLIDQCETMYAFMVDVIKVNIPWYCVEIYLNPNLKEWGKTEASTAFWHPWMNVRGNFDPENDWDRDNSLVTLTHEYYHCMQRNYRDGPISCPKYDEATAQILEEFAWQYYERTGQTVTTKTSFEYDTSFELYGIPLDTWGGEFGMASNVDYGESTFGVTWDAEGVYSSYTAHTFIQFLEARLGEKTPLDMLENYNWSWVRIPSLSSVQRPTFSEMVRSLFDITETDLDSYYKQFMARSSAKYFARKGENAAYAFPKLAGTQGEKVTLVNNAYTTRIRQLTAAVPDNYRKKAAVLVVQDDGFNENFPNLHLLPIGTNGATVKTKYGLLYPQKPASQKTDFYLYEINGGVNSATAKPGGGYTVYTLLAPEMSVHHDEGLLQFQLPEKSAAAQAGKIDGYRVTIKCSDGTETVKYYKISGAGKAIALKADKLMKPILREGAANDADEQHEVTFHVSVCEFIKELDGTRIFGPESDDEDEAMDALLTQMGALSGEIQISLYWPTKDDLDLHCITPDGSHIYYSNKDTGGGHLDVDMQIQGEADSGVENIYFDSPRGGEYQVYIDNYTDRTEGDAPAQIRIKVGGQVIVNEVVGMGSRSKTWTFVYGTAGDEIGFEHEDNE